MPPRGARNSPRVSFLGDLFAQLFTSGARIDAGRCCTYNAFLGLLLLGGALVTRLSAPPDPLGTRGFVLVVACAALLLSALVVPLLRPRLVPALLAAQGLVVVALSVGFALACTAWALGTTATRAFRYLPGLTALGTTYGAVLWADFGPVRARPRPWRLAGFIAGIGLEAVVAVLVVEALLRG